jgi:TRIAD3 protein (E3 ubiquitin-protein ligase RNF216)
MPAVLRSSLGPAAQNEGRSKCEEDVLSCFPDICPDHLKIQAAEHQWESQNIITRLLDDLENDKPYPKRPALLKRKRPEKIEKDEEEEMRPKFEEEDPRLAGKDQTYQNLYIKMG